MRGAYYNENDPYCAAWLRNLIAAKLIAPGDVDERSIVDVRASDLAGYIQCHFFAGIAGWSYALRLAGWPDDEPVWTGSCPCQPLSVAGHRKGHADERHLWPAFYGIIAECAPAICFGEQIASKDGREWLCAVRADLEALGYAVGAANLCAAGVLAPHPRQRIYWLANTCRERTQGYSPSQDLSILGEQEGRGWGKVSQADLRAIFNAPLQPGSRWPQPILRKMDDGVSEWMGQLRAYGNAIVPQVAAQFIGAYLETQ